jgi:hypothetical protein
MGKRDKTSGELTAVKSAKNFDGAARAVLTLADEIAEEMRTCTGQVIDSSCDQDVVS